MQPSGHFTVWPQDIPRVCVYTQLFVVAEHTSHNIYVLHHFFKCTVLALCAFGKSLHCSSPELSISPNRNSMPRKQLLPIPPPLGLGNLYSTFCPFESDDSRNPV